MILIRNLFPAAWSLVREEAPTVALTAADVMAILGDRAPAVAWDGAGPGGSLIFPGDEEGFRLARMLRDQLNAVLREKPAPAPLPGEDFPEVGYLPDPGGDQPGPDFAEPVGGEAARVAAEEAAVARSLASDEVLWAGWRPGDRFKVGGEAGEKLAVALAILGATSPKVLSGACFGHVISRCQLRAAGATVWALLVDYDGALCPVAVPADYLDLCVSRVCA